MNDMVSVSSASEVPLMNSSEFKQILDHGFVRLVESMGSDLKIVQSARISYNKKESKGEEADNNLIHYMINHDHGTPFEVCSITLHIKCPIFVMRQWVKHRISTINEISARYTELQCDYYTPEVWRKPATYSKQGSQIELDPVWNETIRVQYKQQIQSAIIAYRKLIEQGVAKELARTLLPVSVYTEFYWTINLRSLMNFLYLRMHKEAQWEIQQYANVIYAEYFLKLFPVTAKAFMQKHKDRFL